MIFRSSRDKFTLLQQNSVTDVSVGFRPPFWCPSRWAPVWRLHTNLYKFRSKVSPHIFDEKNCCDLNLGESDCIFTGFFLFSDSGLYLFNGFNFYFNLFQEPITRSLQQPHIPLTAFSQTDLFLVWIYLEFRSPRGTSVTNCNHKHGLPSACLREAALF